MILYTIIGWLLLAQLVSSEIRYTGGNNRNPNIRGDVKLGPGNVIDQEAQIDVGRGTILMGSGNVLASGAIIQNPHNWTRKMRIGNGNNFQQDVTFESVSTGDGNILMPGSHVGPNIQLASGCVIGVNCRLEGTRRLSDGTNMYDC